jgi:hypothetical protein
MVSAIPTPAHVVVVVEENHSDAGVIGNKSAPYMNWLDIHAGKAHQLIGAGEPAGITDLGPDDRRAQQPDAVLAGLQRLTATLVSGESSPQHNELTRTDS